MSRREPDDTTKPDPPPPEPEPGSYYYDDATGYEVYDPGEDDEGGPNESEAEAGAGGGASGGRRD